MYVSYSDNVKYTGFDSYANKHVATRSPQREKFYLKDAYKEISDYHKRKVDFYENGKRWGTLYEKDTNLKNSVGLKKSSPSRINFVDESKLLY
jgi:hypothetical protein